MRILFDLNHPADVHQFKNLFNKLTKKKHKLTIVARDKDCTYELLKENKIKFIKRKGYDGIIKKALGIIPIEYKLYKIAKQKKIDLFIGSSGNIYLPHIAKLLKKKCLIFDDTEHAKIQKKLSFPFATKIIVPECYNKEFDKKTKEKVITYNGYKELAYLSPKYFQPSKKGIKRTIRPRILLRLVSWNASHDVGHGGIEDTEKFIEKISKLGTLFISSEEPLPEKLKKYELKIPKTRFHDFLNEQDLVITEGGTVAAEAAILAIPTIYVNDLHMGYTDELEKKGLLIQTTNPRKINQLISQQINKPRKMKLILKRDELLKEKEDVNKFMEKIITKVLK